MVIEAKTTQGKIEIVHIKNEIYFDGCNLNHFKSFNIINNDLSSETKILTNDTTIINSVICKTSIVLLN